jgi:bifunctional ADP-heptose synthase (sugar kinase/adenylyltransferase)
MTAIVVNSWEAGAVAGHAVHDEGQVRSAGKDLLARTNAEHVLLTRGNQGMTLLSDEENEWALPSSAPEIAGDLFGVGDVVVAAFTLALVTGAEAPDAAFLANLCAGLKVGRPPLSKGLRQRLGAVLGI